MLISVKDLIIGKLDIKWQQTLISDFNKIVHPLFYAEKKFFKYFLEKY